MHKANRLRMVWIACFALATILASCATKQKHPPNHPPQVNAGPDLTITLPTQASLKGKATDDGLPMRILTLKWSKQSGPGSITFDNATTAATLAKFSEPGTYVIRLTATDTQLTNSDDLTVTVNPSVQTNRPPQADAGPDQTITLPAAATLRGKILDDGLPAGGTLTASWTKQGGVGTVTFANPTASETTATFSEPGIYVLRLTANDSALTGNDDISVTVDPSVPTNRPPQTNAGPDQTITGQGKSALVGKITDDGLPAGGNLTTTWTKQSGPGMVTFGNTSAVETTAEFSTPGTYVLRLTANDGAMSSSDDITVTVSAEITGLPPDPGTVATPVDPTAATILADATAFLYSGPNAIQTGVAPGTINRIRVAVLRGRVLDKANNALPGATITILNHPEFGQTLSRADGRFDLAVNGGGQLTIRYLKNDFLPVQRQVNAPWQDYVSVEDAILVQQDTKVTAVNLIDTNQPVQVAQGSPITDQDGTRQITLLIPQGTKAEVYNPDGTSRAVTSLKLRLTEYTVGNNGPASMPAPLPPSSAYTYAFEMRADEAGIKRNGKDVLFDRPVPFYINNFLNFPVGTAVPVGYYDQDKGIWVPSDNGKVIKILSVNNGTVEIDSDGDGVADDEGKLTVLGISADEKARLSSLFQSGQSFWRVQVKHLSTWDCNWPFRMPDDAEEPKNPNPKVDETVDDPECKGGSIIECQNQILRESLPIAGTGLTLNYASNRVEGRKAKNAAVVSLTGAQVPASLQHVDLQIDVAGRHFEQRFGPGPNQQSTFIWDGLDAFGRQVIGGTQAKIRIGYVYRPVFAKPSDFEAAFARFPEIPLEGYSTRDNITIWQHQSVQLGVVNAVSQSLSNWTLNIHHLYDPVDKVLYLGTGSRKSADAIVSGIINTVAGGGVGVDRGDRSPATETTLRSSQGIALGPDGSLYIAETENHRIRRVGSDGIITTVAGNGNATQTTTGSFPLGDGGLATAATLYFPWAVALGPDESLYIADRENSRIRRVGSDGVISTVAGNGTAAYSGDGGPATDASINRPLGVALGPDESLYIADRENYRIRRVGSDGIISTVAGNGQVGVIGQASGDGGPATAESIIPSRIAVCPDGTLYIAEIDRIRRVRADGIISTVAGNGIVGFSGDGGPATDAKIRAEDISCGSDGSVYISTPTGAIIRRVGPNGIISTVAGNGTTEFSGDGGPATAAGLGIPTGVAVSPDGNLYITDISIPTRRVRRVSASLPGFNGGELAIASSDGREIYKFNQRGRHLQTLNALTSKMVYQFNYDPAGRLTSIVDAEANTIAIERDSTGKPSAIVAPFGQRTELALDTNGHLASLTNPAGEMYRMTYSTDGLLTEFNNPKGNTSKMEYDGLGRLIRDTNAAGGSTTLARLETNHSYTVALTSVLGRTTSHLIENEPNGNFRRLTTESDGTKTETTIGTDGSRKITQADGTILNLLEGPDPRFGMETPILKAFTMTTGGLTTSINTARAISPQSRNQPVSIQTDTTTINGRTFKSLYEASTKTTTSVSAAGRISKVTTGDDGRIVQSQIAGFSTVRLAYDTHGRLASITQGAGLDSREVKFSYNVQGDLDKLTDPLGRAVSFGYDAAGRVTKQTVTDGREISYEYDANGNLTSLTPPGRPAHAFKYDKVDQTTTYEPPAVTSTGNTVYEYNMDRDLTKITQPDGQVLGIDYDSGGRLQTLNLPNGKLDYAIDAATGKLTKITGQDATLAYSYNGPLLMKTVWTGSVMGQVERTYDNDFRVTSVSVNGANPITYQYDADSLLAKAGDMTLTRSGQNGLLEGTGLIGVTDSYAYDGFGGVTAYEAKYNAASLLRFEYSYDKLGRIIRKNEIRSGTPHTFDYSYDTAGRLSEVKRDGTVQASYGYDTNGNRTHLNGVAIAHYDAQDRLLDYQGVTYRYSANGELWQKTVANQVTRYDYDVLGNLKKVTLPNGTVIEYLVDGQNRRVGTRRNGTIQQAFLYQGQLQPIAELDGTGNVKTRFVYATGINVPDYMIRGGVTYRIIKDHIGSPRFVVDVAMNTVAQELEYDAFGNVIKDTSPGFQPFGFAGGIYDKDTKLVRFGARDYDAETGRWTEKDPIIFEGGDTNLFGYVLSDPLNLLDPFGLRCFDFWKNVKSNFKMTKNAFPWWLAPTMFTSSSVGNAIGSLSVFQAANFARVSWGVGWMGVFGGEILASVARTFAVNALAINVAWNAGVGLGSVINAAIDWQVESTWGLPCKCQ